MIRTGTLNEKQQRVGGSVVGGTYSAKADCSPSSKDLKMEHTTDIHPLAVGVDKEGTPKKEFSPSKISTGNNDDMEKLSKDLKSVLTLKKPPPPSSSSSSSPEDEQHKQQDVVVTHRQLNDDCPCCGNVAKLVCTRCRAVRYCSRLCQKNDWPHHKKKGNCVPIEGRTVIVDLEGTETLPSVDGQCFVMKIQVALSDMHSPMIAYDEERSGLYMISKENCTKKDLLDRTIRKFGLMGGAKAYFKVKLRQDKRLLVYLDQRQEDLGW